MSGNTDVILSALGRLGFEIGAQITALANESETRFGQLGTRFDQLDARLDQLETRQDQFDARLDQLTARLDRSEAAQLQTRTELMARMDRLQDTMTGMRNDVVVNFGATDQVRRAHDSTREELRTVNEMVTLLVKRIRNLEADVRTLKGEP